MWRDAPFIAAKAIFFCCLRGAQLGLARRAARAGAARSIALFCQIFF
ncbi:hypothetical protein A2U01_0094588 [Trifolium medium]|uniref:Uncharacterized protein n=1 Tax=Trifolium medium TaxID=97028 RepID=A0A392UL23_9FABA|nr:hypothetical protein [Trifolium medium]